jgi:hypothetical protein
MEKEQTTIDKIEQLKKELDKQKLDIINMLEIQTQNKPLETLLKKYETATANFNNYSPSQEKHDQKTAYFKYNELETIAQFLQDKIKNVIFNKIENKIKIAFNEIAEADELMSILLNTTSLLYGKERTQTQQTSNKIFNVYRLLEELKEE